MATPHTERQQDDWQPSPLALQRMAFRRRRTIRSAVAAGVSTVVVVLGAGLLLVNAPGWPRLRSTFFDVAYGWEVLPEIAAGLWLNLRLMVVCEIIILILALAIALIRSLRGPVFFPLRAAATVYVDI